MIKRFDPGRRRLLKVGVFGSAVLAAAGGGVALSGKPALCAGCLWLRREDRAVLMAIVPVMLAGALPADRIRHDAMVAEIVSGVDFTIAHFPPTVRDEIRQLFWLLESSFMRPLLTGIWTDWPAAEVAEIHDFLQSWKVSGLDLLRVGYLALHDLIAGAWYANPQSWQRIHYPGPPALT